MIYRKKLGSVDLQLDNGDRWYLNFEQPEYTDVVLSWLRG